MNQQQLDAIKQRVEAAHADNTPVNLDKVKAVALFRAHAVYDVLALVAEVERLKQEVDQAEKKALDYYVSREELRAEVERLTPKPPRQLTPEEIQQRIDDNFFDEEYS
jgi:hypothetical protein